MRYSEKILINTCLINTSITAVFIVIFIVFMFWRTEPKTTCDCAHKDTSPEIVQNEVQKEEPVLETVEVDEPPYFIDVTNNYISEESVASICKYVGDMYDIPPEFLQAIAWVESNYKVDAKGSSGDSGLCQVIPSYHLARMEKLGVTDIMDPYSNILVAADLINDIRETDYLAGDNWAYIVMVYNQGSNAKDYFQSHGLSKHAQKVMDKYYELLV